MSVVIFNINKPLTKEPYKKSLYGNFVSHFFSQIEIYCARKEDVICLILLAKNGKRYFGVFLYKSESSVFEKRF